MQHLPRNFGAYRLLRRIAQGGFGVVYEADSRTSPGRRLALKQLRPEAAESPSAMQRLLHEATVAQAVNHPNVVKVLASGIEGETPFVVMELVEGRSLIELVQAMAARGLEIDWRRALNLVLGAIDGLDAIHRAVHPETGEPLGIVHRDLAPKNLIVTPSASLVVIDLGLGKSNLQDWATRTGTLMGTPRYMSPEQLRGVRVDARSDVYSTAVICFELLTGKSYIASGELHQVMQRALDRPFRAPTSLKAGLPDVLDEILHRALAVDVDERLPSMQALGASLRAVLAGSAASLLDLPEWPELPPSLAAPRAPLHEPSGRETLSVESTFVPEPPTDVSPPEAPTATRSSVRSRWVVGLIFALGLIVGAVLGWVGLSEGPAPMRPVSSVGPTPFPSPRPVAREIAVTPAPRPPPQVPPVSRPLRALEKIRPVKVKTDPPAKPPAAPAVRPLRERVDTLVTRASALKEGRPELVPALNRIITEASLWRAAAPGPESEQAVAKAEARLAELEARSRAGR